MRPVRYAALVIALCCVFALDAQDTKAITFDAFGVNGQGGSINNQDFTVGIGGAVFEIDAFVNIAGQDLNGASFGTSAQISLDPLPAGLNFSFTPVLSGNGADLTLTYSFINNTGGPLTGVTFLAFLDAEIDEALNTFFNEFGTTSGSLAAGQNFEVDEPGFVFGDIFDNLLRGTLDGTNALPDGNSDDVSMAMSFSFTVGSIGIGDTLVVTMLISEEGHSVGSFSITQQDSDPDSTARITFSGQTALIRADSTRPSCAITAVMSGPTAVIEVTTQDTGSGLQAIQVIQNVNAKVSIPPFTAGISSPVVVKASKIKQSQKARVALQVMDVAGNVTACDSVFTTLAIPDRRWLTSQTFTDIPKAEHFITVYNADPGLKFLAIQINNTGLRLLKLRDGEERTIDVASAMVRERNTIIMVGTGQPGTSAFVMISNVDPEGTTPDGDE